MIGFAFHYGGFWHLAVLTNIAGMIAVQRIAVAGHITNKFADITNRIAIIIIGVGNASHLSAHIAFFIAGGIVAVVFHGTTVSAHLANLGAVGGICVLHVGAIGNQALIANRLLIASSHILSCGSVLNKLRCFPAFTYIPMVRIVGFHRLIVMLQRVDKLSTANVANAIMRAGCHIITGGNMFVGFLLFIADRTLIPMGCAVVGIFPLMLMHHFHALGHGIAIVGGLAHDPIIAAATIGFETKSAVAVLILQPVAIQFYIIFIVIGVAR